VNRSSIMTFFILIVYLGLSGCQAANSAGKIELSSERYISSDGSWSINLPEGWALNTEDTVYTTISGPGEVGSQPQLMVKQEWSEIVLELWAAAFQQDILASWEGYSRISEDYLQTDAGETCFRWEFNSTHQNALFHHIVYLFESGDWKLVMIYSRFEDIGAEQDASIDAAMRSVQYQR
jgi:predicted secreted protein